MWFVSQVHKKNISVQLRVFSVDINPGPCTSGAATLKFMLVLTQESYTLYIPKVVAPSS